MLPGKKHHQTLLLMTQLQLGENGQKGANWDINPHPNGEPARVERLPQSAELQ